LIPRAIKVTIVFHVGEKGLIMKKYFLILPLLWGLLPISSVPAAEDANEIVRKADQIRAPEGSYVFEASVVSYDGDKRTGENGYHVSVKDLDHSLVEFRFPASEKGKSMLMLQDDIWIFLPRVNKPVRVPLKHRLLGEVSIGDMTRTNFSHDYDATLVGEEFIEGREAYILDLKAKSPQKPYGSIKYWVAKDNFQPLQAEYFTVSGKSLKTIVFGEFTRAAGALRPLRATFVDSIRKDKKSILTFEDMTSKPLPDKMFSKQAMQTLR
jgi:outer membrane lipoprotein-sorting protein